ncbi:MAG: hypothetical protein GTN78_15435, partial [Gemmatimonadales bacterium]|nr:hypothetical protein [Gemmatimonadales bacterium]NIR01567.1 hypothetical protein [Gemmatimonadales bacterium]
LTATAAGNGCGTLVPGGSCSFSVPYTVQAGDDDPLDNEVTVLYNPVGFPNSITDSDDHTVELFQPLIEVDKDGDTLGKVGDPVDYTITLSNDSSAGTPELLCTAEDTLLGTVFGPDATLPPGDTVINITRDVEQGDPDP